jgi:beta-glucosidase
LGFRRVLLDPGESARVTFELPRARLTLLDEKLDRVLEPGTFRVMVDGSSRDIRRRGTFEIREAGE